MPNISKIIMKDGTEFDIVSKTDRTLSEPNVPADAKAIGVALSDINTKVDNLANSVEQEVFNANTHFDFPSIGSVDCIYKAYKEKQTYQWNAETLTYEPLNSGDFNIEEIEIINGGNANGRIKD